jgi:hypothetical protein
MIEKEVVTVREPATETPSSAVIGARIVYYVGGLIVALLGLRFVLALLGAAQGNAFVDTVYGTSGLFVMPFYGIFGEPVYGQSQLETSTLVAMLVYSLITTGIARLFTIGSRNATEV